MITRNDYMAGNCTHREYHAQFVTNLIKKTVKTVIGLDKLLASTDKYLNDIPLRRWDILAANPYLFTGLSKQMKLCNDYPTQAGLVCILKEAAKQIIEEAKND